MASPIPIEWPATRLADWMRRVADAINGILDGRTNSVGNLTLTANAATSTLTDRRIGIDSCLTFTPMTANAAAELGAGTMYVSARGDGSATITHANNAQTDRDYCYAVHGSGSST